MFTPVQVGKRTRYSYARIKEVMEMPHLLDIQRTSYRWFLEEGLKELLEDISPISIATGNLKLSFREPVLGTPKYSLEECKERDSTYSAPIRVKVQLINQELGDIKEQEVFMGDFPLMTETGTFIINGAERVIVSQLVRSPGVYYDSAADVQTGKKIYNATVIPNRGAWIELETEPGDKIRVRIDRTRKMPVTYFLRALGFETDREILELFDNNKFIKEELDREDPDCRTTVRALEEVYKHIRPNEPATSVENAMQLLNSLFFDPKRYDLAGVGRYKITKKLGLRQRLLGKTLAEDLVDCSTGEIIFPAGTLVDSAVVDEIYHKDLILRQIIESKLKNCTVGGLLQCDIVDEFGKVVFVRGSKADIAAILAHYENIGFTVGDIFQPIVTDAELSELYLEREKEIFNLIEDEVHKGYINPIQVRVKSDSEEGKMTLLCAPSILNRTISLADIIASIGYLLDLMTGVGKVDDIDHLGNRRVRSVGELLQNQFRIGLARMERVVKDRMTTQDSDIITPQLLINIKPVIAAMKEFFGSSQLSQFMDQHNPLSELTHKRRLSALGPGGLSRERAGFEVRDVHNSHYGRMCPIETPEGPNIGLIGSLSNYGRINQYGFIETPYRKVDQVNKKVTTDVRYMTADEEEILTIAQANEPLDENDWFVNERVTARHNQETSLFKRESVDFMDVSPKQVVSIATALIPFLENDDANRALMGANMQRQAVPLLRTQAPLVGTGMEFKAACDSGVMILAKNPGTVSYVDSREIFVDNADVFTAYDKVNAALDNVSDKLNNPLTNALNHVPQSDLAQADSKYHFDKLKNALTNALNHVPQNDSIQAKNDLKIALNLMNALSQAETQFIKAKNSLARAYDALILASNLVLPQDVQTALFQAEDVLIDSKNALIQVLDDFNPTQNISNVPSIHLRVQSELNLAHNALSRAYNSLIKAKNKLPNKKENQNVIEALIKAQDILNQPKNDLFQIKNELNHSQVVLILAENALGQVKNQNELADALTLAKNIPQVQFERYVTAANQVLDVFEGSHVAKDYRIAPGVYVKNPGKVVSISCSSTSTEILIQPLDYYKLQKFVRSNQGTCINQIPIVSVGEHVEKSQPIADGPATDHGELALGYNIIVAYMPWEGYNYEDAILLSENLIKRDIYTSIHIEEHQCDSRDTKLGPEEITRDIPNIADDALANLDSDGIISIGADVRPGDILVGKVTPKGETELTAEERLLRAIFGEKAREVRDTSLRVPHGESGKIVDVKIFTRENNDEMSPGINKQVRVYIAQKRKISVGDKMSGRHGNKGVVSRIMRQEDMPFLADGTPVDIVLNPLGVPSRMNIGQILETHLGMAVQKLGYQIRKREDDIFERLKDYYDFEKYGDLNIEEVGMHIATPVFDGAREDDIFDTIDLAKMEHNAKFELFDGRTGEKFQNPVTVGYVYMLKLHHLVDDKIHARSTGPYSLVTQQPLGGKAQFGGQRFGEMEVWALEAYGAAYTLQEILTVKSDDVVGRVKAYEAIVKGNNIPEPGVPESFKVLIKELQSIGLDIKILNQDSKEIDIRDVDEEETHSPHANNNLPEPPPPEPEPAPEPIQDPDSDSDSYSDSDSDSDSEFDFDSLDSLDSLDVPTEPLDKSFFRDDVDDDFNIDFSDIDFDDFDKEDL